MGSKAINTLLTSPLEFLSSDPECDLLLDLDRNNSTGVYPYDYFDSKEYCSNLQVPICDDDLYLHTSAPLDSIRLTIQHPYDFSAEQLSLSPLPAGFNFISRNDSTYVLIKNEASDAEYRGALLQIRYSHPGPLLSSGERRITIQGFNAIKNGKLTTCFLHLRSAPYAGMDATLLLCRDTIISSFSSITFGQPGGNWSPALSSGADLFNSTFDLMDQYAYFINDPVCGSDTALVTIVTDTSPHPDLLGPDQKLCPNDSLSLSVQGAASILWDDGSSNPFRTIYSPGDYWIASTTPGGCTFKDSITITPGYAWPGIITTTDPTCHQNNGEILIDPSAFVGTSQVIFNSNTTQEPKQINLAAGVHSIKVISDDQCMTEFEVELFDTPVISGSMDSVISVPSGTWGTVPVSFLNSIQPVDVLFTPSENIEWNNSVIHVFGDNDSFYNITFTDKNGCEDTHTLHVLVEQLKGLYLPNIFHPGSNNGNEFWSTIIYPPYQLEVVRVYDRWGNMVYQSSDEIRWDGAFKGKECTSGVYVYQVWVRNQTTGERKNITGDLTLVR
ncbi:MAG TPA: T9SS type B sorting domain-containing protein [Saprospiraceae bacterium]|nr:T9SS type B sorting domain-containing protein [Saprospiraceae bacterium]